jgi:hypothetical protein
MSTTVETATEIRPFTVEGRLYWENTLGFFDVKGTTEIRAAFRSLR